MIVYLIPTCKTCIKQENILKKSPDPQINVRYIPMMQAKKTAYTYPLWVKGRQKYQGVLKPNSFGSVPTLNEVFKSTNLNTHGLCPMLQRPGGPRDNYYRAWQGPYMLANKQLNFPNKLLLSHSTVKSNPAKSNMVRNNFGKSCFGYPLYLGGGNSLKEQRRIAEINNKVGSWLKASGSKSTNKLTANGIKITKIPSKNGITITVSKN